MVLEIPGSNTENKMVLRNAQHHFESIKYGLSFKCWKINSWREGDENDYLAAIVA